MAEGTCLFQVSESLRECQEAINLQHTVNIEVQQCLLELHKMMQMLLAMATWSVFLAVMIGASKTMSWMGVTIRIFVAINQKMTITSFEERDRFIPVPYDWIFQGSLVIIPLARHTRLTSFLNITKLSCISVFAWLPFTWKERPWYGFMMLMRLASSLLRRHSSNPYSPVLALPTMTPWNLSTSYTKPQLSLSILLNLNPFPIVSVAFG